MKIYNKKKFVFGIIDFFLSILLLVFGFSRGFDAEKVILGILMLWFGISEIYLTTNRKAARQDQIEEMDERNRLVLLTSTSKALQIARNIIFVLMLFFLIMGAKWEEQPLMSVGLGLAFSFSIIMFSEIFTSVYYEKHM